MKILFVSSGNSQNGISPIIKNQGESIVKAGIELEYFLIKGKGIKGYFKSIFTLRKHLKNNTYDIVHVHYSLSAIVASLAGAKPLIVSLMGSDVKSNSWFKWILYFFNYFFWSSVIVKSKDMHSSLGIKNAHIIPNGINFDKFKPIDKKTSLDKLNWDKSKKHILFAANPNRSEKNFTLALSAFNILDDHNIELHYLENVPNNMMPYYYNSADVVMLTSLWEGSPNAIKEAMACNRAIVCTDVGDVRVLLSDTSGCYVAKSYDYKEIAQLIQKALQYQKTIGREKVNNLNENNIATKIIEIYKKVKEAK
jgi:teichuronic acid biosynthesis glycosyltransferase TuaC